MSCENCANAYNEGVEAMWPEVERLRAALKRYGRHQGLCWPEAYPHHVCKCGLDAALNSSTGQQNAPVAEGDAP